LVCGDPDGGLGLFGTLVWLSLRHQLIGELQRDLDGRASRFEYYFRNESAQPGIQLGDDATIAIGAF
jgi:hypothetical protein